MSARGRSRTKTYTDRLYRRGGRDRHPVSSWATKVVARVAGRRLAALLAVGVELGHLAAALVEWPASVPRGVLHVVVAAVAGLLAVGVYCGRSRVELWGGLLFVVVAPVMWLVGMSYRDFPVAGAAVVSAVEVTLAGLFVVLLIAAVAPPPSRRGVQRRERVAHRS